MDLDVHKVKTSLPHLGGGTLVTPGLWNNDSHSPHWCLAAPEPLSLYIFGVLFSEAKL